jgi:hypothetical protein
VGCEPHAKSTSPIQASAAGGETAARLGEGRGSFAEEGRTGAAVRQRVAAYGEEEQRQEEEVLLVRRVPDPSNCLLPAP